MIENNSSDCGYIGQLERWVNTGTTCEGYDKYYIQVKEISDDGVNWTRTSDTKLGSLIQRNSTDCGYVYDYLWFATYIDNSTDYAECNDGDSIQPIFTRDNLITFHIGGCATYISAQCFMAIPGLNNSLSAVTIDNGLKNIGVSAFKECRRLTSINIPDSVIKIGEDAFAYCDDLSYVNINNIAEWCGIDFANIPANPVSQSGSLYLNGTEITNLIIPDDVSTIKKYAFAYNKGITSLTISSGTSIIGSCAFEGCTNLTSITCLRTTPPTLNNSNSFDYTNNCPIYVPAGSVDAYKRHTRWLPYASRIQAIPT